MAHAMLDMHSELAKSIEQLKQKRHEVHNDHAQEEEEKAKLQKEMAMLTERMQTVSQRIAKNSKAMSEYDRTIQDTESAYMKILESSQTLLHVIQREAGNLDKHRHRGA